MAEAKKAKKRGRLITVLILCAILVLGAAGAFYYYNYTQEYIAAHTANVRDSITIEAGSSLPGEDVFLIQPLEEPISYAGGQDTVLLSIPGEYAVKLSYIDKTFDAVIRVEDTTAPQAVPVDVSLTESLRPDPSAFVTDITDVTEVAVGYKNEPDMFLNGEQTVTVILRDTSGNATEVSAKLTLDLDTEAPVIEGVKDITVYQGDAVSYRSGVTVTDNRNENLILNVDSSQVDLSSIGVYTVIYSAADAAGNYTELAATVTVMEKKPGYVSYDVIYAEADKILEKIIKDDMTVREQVRAIYKWVRSHCGYVNHMDKSDWMQGAYSMLTDRQGDCFGYFAACKLLMERLEIPNIDVRKVKNYPGDSDHYWSLVSVDGGETYYHLDATPRVDVTTFFLVTDEFLDEYSAAHRNCHNRDKSLYPATPEE